MAVDSQLVLREDHSPGHPMLHQGVLGRHKILLGASKLPIVQEPDVEGEVRDVLEQPEDRLESRGEEEAWERIPLVLLMVLWLKLR